MKIRKFITSLASSLVFAALLTACDRNQDSTDAGSDASDHADASSAAHQEIEKQIVLAYEDLAKAVSSIEDRPSAEHAVRQFDEIGDRMLALADKLKELSPPSKDFRKAASSRLNEVGQKLKAEIGNHLSEVVTTLPNDLGNKVVFSVQALMKKIDTASREFDRHYQIDRN